MSSIEAVIFDMDGVLIDSEPLWQQCEREMLREVNIHVTSGMQEATKGLNTNDMLSFWHSRHPWDSPSFGELTRLYEDQMEQLFRTEVHLIDGAEEAIKRFVDKKIPIALASCSSMRMIDAFLERFGFRKYFDLIVSGADEKSGKPHPAIYINTASGLNTDPTRCMAIEDTFNGMIAAKSARMTTVVMPHGDEYDELRFGAADLKIKTLDELTDEAFEKLQMI